MNVDQLLELMEETLEEGTAVPFAAAKRVVDVDRMRDIIDEVRNNLPDEIRDSKKIVRDKDQILAEAQRSSESIIKKAEERARTLVSEQEVVKRARKYAAELVADAKAQAEELMRSATSYCDDVLKKSEETLNRSINGIKSTRMNLHKVSTNVGAVRPRKTQK